MSTEQFPTVPLATVNGTGPYAVPFSFTNPAHVALRVINADGTTSTVATNLWTLTPTGAVAGGWTGGNITLTTAGATALFNRQIYPERLSNVEQGWAPLPNPREGALSNQLDWLTRGIQEAAHGLSRSLRATTALHPFVAVPERVLAFNASGQPVAGPRITDIENAAINAAIVADAGPVVEAMADLARRGLAARTSLRTIMLSDLQVLYYDARMPVGSRYSQPEIQDALFARMKASFPEAEAIFTCGDDIDRPDVSLTQQLQWDAQIPGHGFVVGDDHPSGYGRLKLSLLRAGWDLSRFFNTDGNHAFAFGKDQHKRAWTSERSREYFGAANYTTETGDLVFIHLADAGGGTSGQPDPQAIVWADDLLSRPTGPTKKWYHLLIHQPIRGYGPVPLHTVYDPVTAVAGEATVVVGSFPYATADAIQIYEGLYTPDATPLEFGVDYTVVPVPMDDEGQPTEPYTTIILTTPYASNQVLQARRVSVDAYQDQATSDALLELLSKHRDKLKVVFYGHRQQLWNSAFTNVQVHPEYGTLFVNNNMALNNAGLTGGLHPITNPAIYTVLDWTTNPTTGVGTLIGRRWNDTAQDWLENTHPDADHTFTVEYAAPFDLGRIGEWHDSRRLVRGTPPTRQVDFKSWDLSELREFDPASPRGDDIVVNGGFTADTDWTKSSGVTISGGVAVFSGVASGAGLAQTVAAAFDTDDTYEITGTVSGYTSGTLGARCGSTGAFTTLATGNGAFSVRVAVTAADTTLQFFNIAGTGSFQIDNLTARRIIVPWPSNRVGPILARDWRLNDKALSDVRAGQELVERFWVPRGGTSDQGGRLAWVAGGPSRLALEAFFQVANNSDSANTYKRGWRGRTPTNDTFNDLGIFDALRALFDAPNGYGMRLLDGSATLASLRTAPTGADPDRVVMIPFSWSASAPADAPLVDATPAPYCQGFHLQRAGGAGTDGSTTQVVFQSAGGSMNAWFRGWTVGAFTAWRKLLHDGNIVVESGSGPTGEFLKFANGRMLCRRYYGDGDAGLTFASRTEGAVTGMWAGTTWAFPAAFSAVPAVRIMGRLSAGATARLFGSFNVNSVTTAEAQVRIWGLPADIDNVKYLMLEAEGAYA